MIKNVIILNRNGLCYFFANFENKDINIDLLTGFFSSLFVINTQLFENQQIESIEIGSQRFILHFNEDLVFIAQSDTVDNRLGVTNRLIRIANEFLKDYKNEIKNFKGNREVFESFKMKCKKIAFEQLFLVDHVLELKLLKLFKRLAQKPEIIGAALLYDTGEIIFSVLPDETTLKLVKFLESRWRAGQTKIEINLSVEPEGTLVLTMPLNRLIVAILFEKETPLGITLVMSQSFANMVRTA